PGQPRVDRAGRGGVQAEEPVLQQPNQLVPVLGPLGEQLEQVQPQPPVTEHGAHDSNSSSTGRRSSATWPETALATNRPVPFPSRPDSAECPDRYSSGKSQLTRPPMAANRTSRSLSSRTRTVISPEIVSNRRSLSCGGLSRSAVSAPEMVFAASRWTAASAMVISPDTVSRLSSPAQPSASIGPETTLARIRP